MTETVLIYTSTPPYTPGEYLPELVEDERGQMVYFPQPAHVDQIASRPAADGGVEYLVHVVEARPCR